MIRLAVEIEQHADNHWTVRVGDRFCPHLTWDEMLGLVVRETHRPGFPPYPLLTTKQHIEHHERRVERIRDKYDALGSPF